jgi:hypothetical protein
MTLMRDYFFECSCARCNACTVIRRKHELDGNLKTLSEMADHNENQGNFEHALKQFFLILSQLSPPALDFQAADEEKLEHFAHKLRRDILERAVYCAIQLPDLQTAFQF